MKVDFTTIARGAHSGYQKASQMVIDSQEEWEDLWQQHASDIEPPPPVPQVDFTRDKVVAAFAGEKPTSGYSVEILTVETRNSQTGKLPSLGIKVKYRQPGDAVQEVITQPHHIIRIPQIAVEQVVFERA